MRVRAAIFADKNVTQKGEWKTVTGTSRMPKNAFPVGTNYPVTFARNWHWRVDRLVGEAETSFRLLTAFNRNIEEFRGWLAVDFVRSAILLARYEFHGHHPGWHCHAPCGEVEPGDAGALRTRDCRRVPGGTGFHKERDFDTTSEERALARSFNFFRVAGAITGLLL